MFPRKIQLPKDKSFFLFGARGTGKSTLISSTFPEEKCFVINLLDLDEELRYHRQPMNLSSEVLALPKSVTHVVIDEIQKLPKLLDVVHLLIETHKVSQKFVLTGSSARKLRAGGANLLAGRAIMRSLFPLTFFELSEEFDVEKAIHWGGLPAIWNSHDEEGYDDFLRTYANTYLKEEIWNEQLVRNLDPFRRFLEVAAIQSGRILNYRKIALDVGVDTKTVQFWYGILEDTLVGTFLDAYHSSVRKQLRQAPKFYFFDTGVTRALSHTLSTRLSPQTSQYGYYFEQMVLNHIFIRNIYEKLDYRFSYLMTKNDLEIDLIVKKPDQSLVLVEIKSTDHVREDHGHALKHFSKDFPEAKKILLSQDPKKKDFDGVVCMHWIEGVMYL